MREIDRDREREIERERERERDRQTDRERERDRGYLKYLNIARDRWTKAIGYLDIKFRREERSPLLGFFLNFKALKSRLMVDWACKNPSMNLDSNSSSAICICFIRLLSKVFPH